MKELAIVLLVAGVVLGGCAAPETSTQAPPPTTVPVTDAPMDDLPPAAEQDAATPESVTRTVLAAWGSFDPKVLNQPLDSVDAVRDYMTAELADRMNGLKPDEPLPPLWEQWKTDGDIVIAMVTTDDPIMVDDTSARLTAHVDQKIMHKDGDATPYSAVDVDVACTREEDGWKVAAFTPIF